MAKLDKKKDGPKKDKIKKDKDELEKVKDEFKKGQVKKGQVKVDKKSTKVAPPKLPVSSKEILAKAVSILLFSLILALIMSQEKVVFQGSQ